MNAIPTSGAASAVAKAASALPTAARPATMPGVWSTMAAIIRKDFLLEWRGRARLNATLFFSLLTLLLFSFTLGPKSELLRIVAPGFLWLAILLSSVMSLGESMRIEKENDAIDGLRLLPVDARGMFLGKAIVNTGFLMLLSLLMVPFAVAIYDVDIVLGIGPLFGVLFVGSAAISAPGTLYAAIAAQARARDVLLPLLLFPILIPALLASVKATTLIMHGDPMMQAGGWGELGDWLQLLSLFTLAYWSICTVMFGRVIEE